MIFPSGRTVTDIESSGLRQTVTLTLSSGPDLVEIVRRGRDLGRRRVGRRRRAAGDHCQSRQQGKPLAQSNQTQKRVTYVHRNLPANRNQWIRPTSRCNLYALAVRILIVNPTTRHFPTPIRCPVRQPCPNSTESDVNALTRPMRRNPVAMRSANPEPRRRRDSVLARSQPPPSDSPFPAPPLRHPLNLSRPMLVRIRRWRESGIRRATGKPLDTRLSYGAQSVPRSASPRVRSLSTTMRATPAATRSSRAWPAGTGPGRHVPAPMHVRPHPEAGEAAPTSSPARNQRATDATTQDAGAAEKPGERGSNHDRAESPGAYSRSIDTRQQYEISIT